MMLHPLRPVPRAALAGIMLTAVFLFSGVKAHAQKFVATGSMQVPRYRHTAVLLRNGEVLLAGGNDGKQLLSSAEIYDPHTGQFHWTGSLHAARQDAAGALLPDGEVLIAGGHDALNRPLSSAEVYDPHSGQFHATDNLKDPLDGIVAYRLRDGDIVVLGKSGCSTTEPVCTDSVEIYDPKSHSFLRAGDLPLGSGSWGFGSAQLKDDDLLVIGGYLPVGTAATQSAEIFEPENRYGRFTSGQTVVDELKPAAVTLPDGTVLIAGGVHHSAPATLSEIYDPGTDGFTYNGTSNTDRIEHLILLRDHKVLAIGGGAGFDGAELYVPASHQFRLIGSMQTGHSGDTATLLQDGRVLIAGGIQSAGFPPGNIQLSQPSAELFVPFWFQLWPAVREKKVDGNNDWVAFKVYVGGQGADETRVELSCWAAHLECDAYPDDVALGGRSYIIVHGLGRLKAHERAVWVKGSANGKTQTVKFIVVK